LEDLKDGFPEKGTAAPTHPIDDIVQFFGVGLSVPTVVSASLIEL
jgi:hypothetical protein